MSKSDKRPRAWAPQAGTSGFEDWYLYGRRSLPENQKQKVRNQLQPIAPLRFIGGLSAPLLLQSGGSDIHVPMPCAEALSSSATGAKRVVYYDAGQGFSADAIKGRVAWLRHVLAIKARRAD